LIMPTRIEMLKQAGFSDDEIGDWAKTERQRMQEAGFTDGEIDDEFGVTRPPKEVPPAFTERLKQGWLYRVLGAAGEYARNYFGDEPLGFSPESQRQLGKFGIVGDLAAAAGGPIDALLRSVPAGIAGVGAGLGQLYEEGHDAALGPDPYAKGKAARDFAQLAQIAALLSGAKGPTPGLMRTPVPKITNGPVIELPRAEDFRNAGASISGTVASFPTEQKLLRLWTEHGIHPAEAADDALKDRAIADSIRSDSDNLPEVYVGANKAVAAAGPQTNAHARAVGVGQLDEGHLPAEQLATTKNAASQQPQRDAAASAVSAGGRAALMDAEDGYFPNLSASEPARTTADSKITEMFNPPAKEQRPFTEDYPDSAGTRGRLLVDIEGRPLDATFIAGRRRLGGVDRTLSPADIKAAIRQLGIRYGTVPARSLPENAGGQFVGFELQSRPHGYIFVNRNLPLSERKLTTAHEFGHAIDFFANEFSKKLTQQEITELRAVYGTLKSGLEQYHFFWQPEEYGYEPNQVNRELVAEGLRAYMANPNYFKTVAPKTAAKIRAEVNANPHLKSAIQFNSLAAAALIGAGVRDQNDDNQ